MIFVLWQILILDSQDYISLNRISCGAEATNFSVFQVLCNIIFNVQHLHHIYLHRIVVPIVPNSRKVS